jgi:basic amino acid/polyamine antiporter, APA family
MISEALVMQGVGARTNKAAMPGIGPLGFFTLAFGAIVGSGWVIVLGEWFRTAAPGGALVGFILAAVAMLLIGLCFAELAIRFPEAGGEFAYVKNVFGRQAGFMAGWFVLLFAVSICAFEGIALAWVVRALIPGVALPPVYDVLGQAVTADALLIGIASAVGVGLIHAAGGRWLIGFQNVVTLGFMAAAIFVIIWGTATGHAVNALPLFAPPGGGWASGAAWVFATGALFLNGFQAALHGVEERRSGVPVRTVVFAMLAGIAAAAIFYCGIIVATAFAAPWQETARADLPVSYAFSKLPFGAILGPAILAIAAVSITKTWTALALIGSRVLAAQSRAGMLPEAFARLHPRTGVPFIGIVLLTISAIAGILFGRAAVTAVVNTAAISLSFVFVACVLALARQRQRSAPVGFMVPGGLTVIWLAALAALLMAVVGLIDPWLRNPTRIPAEWLLIVGWGLLGLVIGVTGRQSTVRTAQNPERQT